MSWRNMVIGEQTWQFRFGAQSVVIKSPEGKSTIVDYSKLTGKSWGIIERGQYKKTEDGMVTPRFVRKYIEENLI